MTVLFLVQLEPVGEDTHIHLGPILSGEGKIGPPPLVGHSGKREAIACVGQGIGIVDVVDEIKYPWAIIRQCQGAAEVVHVEHALKV